MIVSCRIVVAAFVLIASFVLGTQSATASDSYIVYVGTYPTAKSKGIYSFRFDATTGKATPALATLMAETPSPSMLALHPGKKFLYATNELDTYNGRQSGSLSAYAIREDGRLELLNVQATGGSAPCFVSVDPSGQCALVANYNGGSVAALPIGSDGKLGVVASFIQNSGSSINSQRQTSPHAHWIATDPANKFSLVCDLGLDKVLSFRFDAASATLTAATPPSASVTPGAGPRHLVFHTNGRWAYVISELNNSITVFDYDGSNGALHQLQSISTLPSGYTGASSAAEVLLHPNGRFLYGSNRGHDSIAVYSVDQTTGLLTLVQHQATLGRTPRNFAMEPGGRWLLVGNQDSDTITVFGVDAATGRLTATGDSIPVGAPTSIVFVDASDVPVGAPGRLSALSVRGYCGVADKVLIAGVITRGPSQKRLVLRGIGPNLRKESVSSYLQDPLLRLFQPGGPELARNDNWSGDDGRAYGPAALDAGSRDSVLYLNQGETICSAVLSGVGDTTGEAMIEVYDANPQITDTRIFALSVRIQIDPGQTVIPGLVVAGPGPRKVIMRAIGPSMSQMAVSNGLPDPKLELYSAGVKIQENDNWTGEDGSSIQLMALPVGSKDAVLITTLQPGNYALLVSGTGSIGGIALIEIYEMP